MRDTAATHSVSSLTVSQTIGRVPHFTLSAYGEDSLDGITDIEWIAALGHDPLEDRTCGHFSRRRCSR